MNKDNNFPIIGKTIRNFDLLLATTGLLFSILLTLFVHLRYDDLQLTVVSALSSAGFATYLLFRRRNITDHIPLSSMKRNVCLFSSMLFLILFSASMLTLAFRPDPYIRPVSYFVLTLLMITVVCYYILLLPQKRYSAHLALLYIIITGLSLQWSQLFIFPTVVGIDPWYHQYFAQMIFQLKHVPMDFYYSMMPAFHLLTNIATTITDLNYKSSVAFSIGLPYLVCNVLSAFLLGKFIHSIKAGLLAALFLTFASFHIRYGFWTIPNSMAVIFIPLIILLLFRLKRQMAGKNIFLVALFMIVLLVTHPLPAVSLVATLLLLGIWATIYKKLRHTHVQSGKLFLYSGLIFAIMALSWWALGTGHIDAIIRTINRSPALYNDVLGQSVHTLEQISTLYTVPISEQLFNYLGMFLFIYFAIIGSLYLLSRRSCNIYGFSIVLTAFTLLIINLIAFILKINIYVGRWLHFIQILLAVPTGVSILWMRSLPRKIEFKVFSCIIPLLVLGTITVSSPYLNMDNRVFAPNSTVRYAFVNSELQTIQTLDRIYDYNIGSDWYVRDLFFQGVLSIQYQDISANIRKGSYHFKSPLMIWIRKDIMSYPFKSDKGIYSIGYNPDTVLDSQGYSHIYCNNENDAFIRQ